MRSIVLLALPLAACSSISISTDFEGGNLGRIEKVSDSAFRCAVAGQADQDGRNRQASWYYFRLDGARGREMTITMTDLRGEYNYKPGGLCVRDDTPPVVSADGKTWRHLDNMKLEKDEATFRVTPDADRFWIAHIEPYTASRLDAFLAAVPAVKEELLGATVEGRRLRLLTITNPAVSADSKKVVWLMVRQHAWESGTSFVGEGALQFLTSDEARSLRDRIVFKILPMMDPDGCAHGGIRFNRHGYDVNRNWDSADPANPEHRRLMPEITAAKNALLAEKRIDLFLTLHNQETGEWLSGSDKHKDLADRFFAALRDRTTFSPSDKGPRPVGPKPAPGRAGVYQYLEGEHGLAAFILEQGVARSPKLGRLPTSQDRREFGRQLARVMCEVVLEK